MIIEENHELILTDEQGKAFITLKVDGYTLKKLDQVIQEYPRLKVSNFIALKKAIAEKSVEPIEIGFWNESIELTISNDFMQASLTIRETLHHIKKHMIDIQSSIKKLLQEHHIIHGIQPFDLLSIPVGKAFIIAQGLEPQEGEPAQVRYLEPAEKKPVIREDGKADYFDMNFILEIHEGSWLGEKIPSKEGENGFNILGEIVSGKKGKDLPLKYDPKSAYEVEEDGKIVLRSRLSGVIGEVNGMLSVKKHLVIAGDLGLETGNITFDGSIQIKGTVMAGYSVVATGDISIESLEGVNAAKLIKSTEGDVFIKGGIFGKGETMVEACKNIYIKHVNDCTLEAKGNVIIGFYAISSNISAHEVILDERRGKIIGGKTLAIQSILAAYSGNDLERKTELIVQSVDRLLLIDQMKWNAEKSVKQNLEITKLSAQVDQLEQLKNNMNTHQIAVYQQTKQKLHNMESEAKEINDELQKLKKLIQETKNSFIQITKEANAGTVIQIGNKISTLSKRKNGKFLLENGELNV